METVIRHRRCTRGWAPPVRVYIGNSADTPAFAVDAIAGWWEDQGLAAFATAKQLLILADAGGSNSCRARCGRSGLQTVLCDRLGLQVTVCHYPTGCSKWNPIEHRLFSFISGNCAGTPLRTWELFLAAIRGTTTRAGLTVEAVLHTEKYQTGWTVTNALTRTLNLEPHAICPAWSWLLNAAVLFAAPTGVPTGRALPVDERSEHGNRPPGHADLQ